MAFMTAFMTNEMSANIKLRRCYFRSRIASFWTCEVFTIKSYHQQTWFCLKLTIV